MRFLIDSKSHKPDAHHVKKSVNFIINAEDRFPTLKNAILAYYTLAKHRIYTWNELCQDLNVKDPVLDAYRGPESVMTNIYARVSKQKENLTGINSQLQDIKEIRKRYFQFDSNGKVRVDFLDTICDDVVRRTYPENQINDHIIKSHKTEPHRLLYVVLKDFDISSSFLLSGAVNLRGGGTGEEVLVFKQGLFKHEMDEFSNIYRDIDVFVKKFKNLTYTFSDFLRDLKEGSADSVVSNFLSIVKASNKLFNSFATDLKVVMDNHYMAVDAERNGHLKDKLTNTRSIPIETLEIGMRFIPHSDREIMSSTRMAGKSVEDALHEITMNLFNYLYIFRDSDLAKKLGAGAKLQAESKQIKESLHRMGVKE